MGSLSKVSAEPARVLIVGFPKMGKTSTLASLANAGFKLRIMNYDSPGSAKMLASLVDKKYWDNINIVNLSNDIIMGSYLEVDKKTDAFKSGFALMNHWVDEDGTDLGVPADWGIDTVVVLDTTTNQGEAAMARAMRMQNKTFGNDLRKVYDQAGTEQAAFLRRLCSAANHYNVIVMSHMKIVGPREPQQGESDIAKRIKEEVAELIQSRYYPNVVGWQRPQHIGGLFPCIIEVASETKGGKLHRYINTQAREELDLGVPAKDIPSKLELDDGLLKVFDAIGVPRPQEKEGE